MSDKLKQIKFLLTRSWMFSRRFGTPFPFLKIFFILPSPLIRNLLHSLRRIGRVGLGVWARLSKRVFDLFRKVNLPKIKTKNQSKIENQDYL